MERAERAKPRPLKNAAATTDDAAPNALSLLWPDEAIWPGPNENDPCFHYHHRAHRGDDACRHVRPGMGHGEGDFASNAPRTRRRHGLGATLWRCAAPRLHLAGHAFGRSHL